MPPKPPNPNFLIIGAERSATGWLRHNLDQHPEIYAPPLGYAEGELPFFCRDLELTGDHVRDYRSRFLGWDGEPFVGETSTAYLQLAHEPAQVARRIAWALDDVRLIAIVRQPIDRLYSAVLDRVRRGKLATDVDLFDLACNSDPMLEAFSADGRYAQALRPFRERFGDRLLVLLFDDVRDRPEQVYEAALRHIGAAPDFVPPDLHHPLFASSEATRELAPTLSLQHRQMMYLFYRPEVAELETLMDRDLTGWDLGIPEPLPAT